jgi:hypothetical protein
MNLEVSNKTHLLTRSHSGPNHPPGIGSPTPPGPSCPPLFSPPLDYSRALRPASCCALKFIKTSCQVNHCLLHPSFLQPPLPTTPTPVPKESDRKPLSSPALGAAPRSPSPPPRGGVPMSGSRAPALSPVPVSSVLLQPRSCLAGRSRVALVLRGLRRLRRGWILSTSLGSLFPRLFRSTDPTHPKCPQRLSFLCPP